MLRAADGIELTADLHVPVGPPRVVALLAPAMGVRRSFYRPLAAFLAEAGVAVLVLDYRGIGQSGPANRRDIRPVLHDWADLDLAAAVAYLRVTFPDAPLTYIGHSIGGQLLGLLEDPPISRALLIGSQHGHWRNWQGWPRLAMAALWWAVVPTAVALAGRLPMRALGQGEDVPAGVAREWARWGRDRDYAVGFAARRGGSGYQSFRGDLLSYAITDDSYAPPSTVKPLLAAFTSARRELLEISPARCGVDQLGHFGPFRAIGKPLWDEWRDWLLEAAAQKANGTSTWTTS